MATTSGTVGSTVLDTVKVIDHAVRRCGLSPSTLTPEQLETAMDNLHLILASLTNRGLNLWCIDKELVPLAPNKATYFLSPGTLDVMDVNYRTVTPLAHGGTLTADRYVAVFDVAVAVKLVGVYFNTTREHDFIFEVSNDGLTWATAKNLGSVVYNAGSWLWAEIDPAFAVKYFRVLDTRPDATGVFNSLGVDTVMLCNQFTETTLSPMSRDTYNSLPNKRIPGRPNQFYFNKQIVPELILYPEPNDGNAHLVVRRQRYIQDVGSMQNKLEIPERWFQAIIWKLAESLSYELEGVDEKRRIENAAHAERYLNEAEDGETDGSPFFLQPNISHYTK